MSPALPTLPRDFGFSEEHALLQKSARRWLAERFDRAALRHYVDDPRHGFDASSLREVAALGWTALTASEASGGSGLGWLHAALLCEELGRALTPLPVASCILASSALGGSSSGGGSGSGGGSSAETWATRIASGDAVAAIAHGPPGVEAGDSLRGAFAGVGCAGARPGDGVDGVLLAPFASEGVVSWHAVALDNAGVTLSPEEVVDPTRPTARVVVDAARAEQGPVPRALADGEALRLRALVLHAAEALGAAEAALAMTRDYACDRQQFGRPIGTYQAVSHPIVDCMIAIENARSLTIAAAAALDAAQDASIVARMAKAAASDALWRTTSRGVQLHGGFGFTWDCDMHFYFRRALHDRGALGDPDSLRRQLAAALFA